MNDDKAFDDVIVRDEVVEALGEEREGDWILIFK